MPPDEPAHVSFVAYEGAEGRLVPRYEEMRLLDDAGRFGELPNYLAHPALSYAVVGGLAGMAGEPENQPLEARTRRLRRASAPLFVAAAALFLTLGWRRPWPLAGHVGCSCWRSRRSASPRGNAGERAATGPIPPRPRRRRRDGARPEARPGLKSLRPAASAAWTLSLTRNLAVALASVLRSC